MKALSNDNLKKAEKKFKRKNGSVCVHISGHKCLWTLSNEHLTHNDLKMLLKLQLQKEFIHKKMESISNILASAKLGYNLSSTNYITTLDKLLYVKSAV